MLHFHMLCYGKFVYINPAVFLASLIPQHIPLCSHHLKVASETLLHEKWSSISFFHITFSVAGRLEWEG